MTSQWEWRHNENGGCETMTIAGLWRYGDWRHVATVCTAVAIIIYYRRWPIVDWKSGVSVRPSVRLQKIADFDLIWYVGRSRPYMRTSVTSTRSKVKIKVTELQKLQKLHFSAPISSAVLAWSSKRMMIGDDSMGPGLVGARFLNFLLGTLSREFKLRRMSIFHEIQTAIFR